MSFRGSTLTQSSGHAQGPESPARIPPRQPLTCLQCGLAALQTDVPGVIPHIQRLAALSYTGMAWGDADRRAFWKHTLVTHQSAHCVCSRRRSQ